MEDSQSLDVINSRDDESYNLPIISDWEDGSYLIFNSIEQFRTTYDALDDMYYSQTEADQNVSSNELLDQWEDTRNFYSMRRAYEEYEDLCLASGLALDDIVDIPVIDDALATMLSPDGLVVVDDMIYCFKDQFLIRGPITMKDRLYAIVEGGDALTASDYKKGIEIESRGMQSSCSADFDFIITSTGKVIFDYTGTPRTQNNQTITWDIERGAGSHLNQTHVEHTFESNGNKRVCVTFTETEVKTITIYAVRTYQKDTIVQLEGEDRRDTTIVLTQIQRIPHEIDVIETICSETVCREFTIGGCTANFDFTEGHDNVVNFFDRSTTASGAPITSWLWSFGDGTQSTEQHPTHTYDCDGDYEVTLIINSDDCINGSDVANRTIRADGFQCCDHNPDSRWRDAGHPTNPENQKIEYRYDMGTAAEWLLDQDFKAKIKYYEWCYGGVWPFKGWKWCKRRADLDVDVNGTVFGEDEDDCLCMEPVDLELSPDVRRNDKAHTFKDDMSRAAFSKEKIYRMNRESDVILEYRVDGVLYVTQHCQGTPGFHCE